MKINNLTISSIIALTGLCHGQSYVADYTLNPFTNGVATDLDDSSWVASAYGRTGAVVSDPDGEDNEESFYKINSPIHSALFSNIGDKASITTAFYSDSTTGSGTKESTVYLSLGYGISALIGDKGDGSGDEYINLGIGANGVQVTGPSFTLATDTWVDAFFEATYTGYDLSGTAKFDYKLVLSGGMTGTYTATGVTQPTSSPVYDVVGNAQVTTMGQEGDSDAQTIYWSQATVPEPSSVALLGLGGIALILRRKK